MLDPSIVDENSPFEHDADLDMFDKRNEPPYDREWLGRYAKHNGLATNDSPTMRWTRSHASAS